MKKLVYLIIAIVALGLIIAGCFSVVPPAEKERSNNSCATIQDGTILDVNSNIITSGYDKWGYNYQAHIFNGYYHNSMRKGINGIPYTKDTIDQAPSETWLVMKWSDVWLSNKDCNLDTKLDRGYACDPVNANSSACAGAWVTNHQSGESEDNEKKCKWTYFVKIVKAPEGAYKAYKGDVLYWYTADDIEIGSVIWGAYARIQQVYNDQCEGYHGIEYLSSVDPGLGEF